jgi:hypothetical protein
MVHGDLGKQTTITHPEFSAKLSTTPLTGVKFGGSVDVVFHKLKVFIGEI